MNRLSPPMAMMLANAAFSQSFRNYSTTKKGPGRHGYHTTPSRKSRVNKNGLPAYFPGAKIARKAAQGVCTIRAGNYVCKVR